MERLEAHFTDAASPETELPPLENLPQCSDESEPEELNLPVDPEEVKQQLRRLPAHQALVQMGSHTLYGNSLIQHLCYWLRFTLLVIITRESPAPGRKATPSLSIRRETRPCQAIGDPSHYSQRFIRSM